MSLKHADHIPLEENKRKTLLQEYKDNESYVLEQIESCQEEGEEAYTTAYRLSDQFKLYLKSLDYVVKTDSEYGFTTIDWGKDRHKSWWARLWS
jgi:hypothetical protein